MTKHPWKGKRLLLISGPMGNGHVSAAAALERCAKERYPDLEVVNLNILDFMTRLYRNFYTKYYLGMLNNIPLLWSFLYHKLDAPPSESPLGRFVVWLRCHTGKKILKAIFKLKPDYIICTHFLPAEILNELKREGKLHVPVAVVVTDFSLHWVYVRHHLDKFFVNCDEVAFRLAHSGIPKERIHVSGCPVMPEFSRPYSEEDVKRLKDEFGLDRRLFQALVTMGGEGVGRIDRIAEMLLSHFPDAGVIAMSGNNAALHDALLKLAESYPGRLKPVPFTNRVADYMAVSDLVVTKPGGIFTSECLAMRKRMIIMYPIPGQEERNADFLLERSLVTKAYDEVSLLYKGIMRKREPTSNHARRMESFSRPNASYDILAVMLEGKENWRYEG